MTSPVEPTVPIAQAARLLGCSPLSLTEEVALTGGQVPAVSIDALLRRPPEWLLRARAEVVLAEVLASVTAELEQDAALGVARTEAFLAAAAAQTLTDTEVAELLQLPVEAVTALAPRRGWTPDAVTEVLRTEPDWASSPMAARAAAAKATQRARASTARRSAAASAKERAALRNRQRWAEVANVSLEEVPERFTKAPTPTAIERFLQRPPHWANPRGAARS